jgi:hypothetical protein
VESAKTSEIRTTIINLRCRDCDNRVWVAAPSDWPAEFAPDCPRCGGTFEVEGRTDSEHTEAWPKPGCEPVALGGKYQNLPYGALAQTLASVFDAPAASVAVHDPETDELVYVASWGAGASEVVGMRLAPGIGLAGSVMNSGRGEAIPNTRADERFAERIAAGTGYVPYTMLLVPLISGGKSFGVLSILDRRDGRPFTGADLEHANALASFAAAALH